MTDNFRGDNANLVSSINALLILDAAGALVPHGVGGHARALLSAAASRLAAGASSGTDEFKEAYQEGHFQGYSEGIEAGRREYSASISATIAALRERIAGMEKDAERYRWLRGEGFDRPAHMWVTKLPDGIPVVHSDLDEAIDAAIAKEKQG